MRLSWNEIRTRAAGFAKDWSDASYEKGETQSFYNAFFQIFGVRRRSVARYEQHVTKLDNRSGFIDLFWPGVLLVEQKSAGRSLEDAFDQAGEYFDALREHQRPRYILVSDFQTFALHDLSERQTLAFGLSQLPEHVEAFGFILGIEQRTFRDQDPANIAAAELVGTLHDAMFAAGYTGHALELFLVRTVFCLFADDTGIFEPRDIFLDFLEARTSQDGADLGPKLMQLFQVLNTPEDQRQHTLDEDLAQFPYVNGRLFEEPLLIPSFDASMRASLLRASRFDWSSISPAIFGALFQSVMDPEERRAQGAHYTTEKNILKVIEPLFLDDLRAELKRLAARKDSRRNAELRRFHGHLGALTFFDPACGCGNFLIIAYRELRLLEIDVLKALYPDRQQIIDVALLSRLNVDQFYGMEISEFPVRIAESALWMMDHIMNRQLSHEFGQAFLRIPIEKSPHIHHGDALELDWSTVLPPEECSYVFGNPPFVGAKMQSKAQRAQVRRIAQLGGSGGTLDYVAAWFIKTGEYLQNGKGRIGFVATNSISQGQQVAQLWPILFNRCNLEIAFAHRTFAWGSDARGKAHVHVVILGLDRRESARPEKLLFSYSDINGEPAESRHSALSPYLIDGQGLGDPHLVVREERRPINRMKQLIIGSQPIDGGHYIFNRRDRDTFLKDEPGAADFMRPLVGAREFLQGGERWILALHEASPAALAQLPMVRERIKAVREFRQRSKRVSTLKLAHTPTLFQVNVLPARPFLVIPEVTTQRRDYIPIGYLNAPEIPSNLVKVLSGATRADFALLTSSMHMAWMRLAAGRLASSYRYSVGMVYNTFPTPPGYPECLVDLTQHAQTVLEARAMFPDSTLSQLYDPDLMPPQLLRAHQQLDRAVDRLYRRKGFDSERDRIECLLKLYGQMRAPIDAALAQRPTRRRKRKSSSRARN